ncbi:hypothetical protein BJX61DRAFT_542237 [Aspergillus egyptiacus]|nr:hypothetical protein BJX61DRAFT_542237 [Aspergillus egyptiacus]
MDPLGGYHAGSEGSIYARPQGDQWAKDIKLELLQQWNEIQPTGSFFTTHTVEMAINPVLISTVLAWLDCHSPPTSCVDESVRKTWELDAEQFTIRNPKWQSQIHDFLKQVILDLGLSANPEEVQAELYKLLVYDEGAFFLPHQDSEKAPGMFGTLVVCLPSKHEGGEVVATHRGDSRVFNSSATSEFEYSYAAWYSDVKHGVKPVTSGCRVVLTYNLIHRPSIEVLKQRDSAASELQAVLIHLIG